MRGPRPAPPEWEKSHTFRDADGHPYFLDPLFHPATFAEWREIRNPDGQRTSRVSRAVYLRIHRGETVLVNGILYREAPSNAPNR